MSTFTEVPTIIPVMTLRFAEYRYICSMELKKINLDSIDAYNRLYGLPTHHPLVAVVDLREATRMINNARVAYGVYALFLKNGVHCALRYGRRSYDYQEGTVVSFAPGQVVDVELTDPVKAPDVRGLVFHPDVIYGTPLADKIADFSFFDYSQMEAVHLSDDERAIFLDCLAKIRQETEHPVDSHSASLLSASIQLLLEYMHRFYDRQFITRHRVNSDVVARFERQLKEYFESDRAREEGMPTVGYFASMANLTPGYFGDLVKRETGSSPKDLITLRMVDRAKHRLLSANDDISLIAYDLGFEYPAHFTRLFKRVTGKTPSQFRISEN